MFRRFLILPALALASQAPAAAQAPANASPQKKCELSTAKKRGSSMFGNMLGGLASRALGRAGSPVAGFIPINTFSSMLTDAIACRLDAEEQKKAAAATTDAVRGGVGTTSSWTSTTREGVTGSSTVTAQNASADGTSCMSVSDVVIVDGEETTVSKRMCRAPGASGYVLAA